MATHTSDLQDAAAVVNNLEKVPLETISLDGFTSHQILTYLKSAFRRSKENPVTFPWPAAKLNDPGLLLCLQNTSSFEYNYRSEVAHVRMSESLTHIMT